MVSKKKQIIKDINSIDYVIFQNDWCKYSRDAVDLLKKKKQNYKKYNIGCELNKLVDFFKKEKDINFSKDYNTRPLVFYKGGFTGGYTDLVKHLKNKKVHKNKQR